MIDADEILTKLCQASCDAIGESYDNAPLSVRVAIRADTKKFIMALGLRGLMVITGEHYATLNQGNGAVLPLRGGGSEGEAASVDAADLRLRAPGYGAHGVRDESAEGGGG